MKSVLFFGAFLFLVYDVNSKTTHSRLYSAAHICKSFMPTSATLTRTFPANQATHLEVLRGGKDNTKKKKKDQSAVHPNSTLASSSNHTTEILNMSTALKQVGLKRSEDDKILH